MGRNSPRHMIELRKDFDELSPYSQIYSAEGPPINDPLPKERDTHGLLLERKGVRYENITKDECRRVIAWACASHSD